MNGIVIEYDYTGDEMAWNTAVETFISNINADPALNGKFTYEVTVIGDGPTRLHIGHWDSPETLAYLQSQDFFKTFAGKVGDFAGGAQKARRFATRHKT